MLNRATLVWATAGLLLVGTAPHPLGATEYKHRWLRRRRQAEYPEDHAAEGFQALVQGSVEDIQGYPPLRRWARQRTPRV